MQFKGLNTQDVLSILVFAECPEHGLEIGFVRQLSAKFRPMRKTNIHKNQKIRPFEVFVFFNQKPKA